MSLKKRTDATTYLSRVRVPKELVSALGKTHMQKSTGTSSHSEAKAIDRIFEGECQKLFDKKRRELRGESTLTTEQVREIALKAVREYRENQGDYTGGSPVSEEFASATCKELEEECRKVAEISISVINEFVDPGSTMVKVPVTSVVNTTTPTEVVQYFNDELNRLNLREQMLQKLNESDIDLIVKAIPEQYQLELLNLISGFKPWHIKSPPPQMRDESPSGFPELIDNNYNLGSRGVITIKSACEMTQKQKWWTDLPEKTQRNYDPAFKLLRRLFGDDCQVHTLAPEHSSWLRNMIDNLPMYLEKSGDARKLIEAAMQAREAKKPNAPETIAANSKNKYRTVIRQIFSCLQENWYIKTDITSGLKPWSNSDKKFFRVQFSDEDLRAIFKKLCREPRDSELFWIPLLAIFTGARRGELCQLTPADIIKQDEVWSFRISSDGDDKSLKNAYSSRIVPIHSQLIEIGFLDFIAVNQKNENGRIWKYLLKNNNGWGDHFGKKFGRTVAELFEEKEGTCKDFHSFRHTVKDILEQQVDYSILDALLGWSSEERRVFERVQSRKKHTRDGYAPDRPINRLREAIELIQYPWLKVIVQ